MISVSVSHWNEQNILVFDRRQCPKFVISWLGSNSRLKEMLREDLVELERKDYLLIRHPQLRDGENDKKQIMTLNCDCWRKKEIWHIFFFLFLSSISSQGLLDLSSILCSSVWVKEKVLVSLLHNDQVSCIKSWMHYHSQIFPILRLKICHQSQREFLNIWMFISQEMQMVFKWILPHKLHLF